MADLKPIEQKIIDFQEGEITAVMVQDENGRENIYVPLKPLVEGMGLQWSAQRKRMRRNPSLDEVVISVSIMDSEKGRGKGRRKMLCLPISYLNGFLFGIEANKVKPEIRPLIIEYQKECYRVLFQAFNGIESMTRFYMAVGFDAGWIDARIKKHVTSTELGDVWLINGVPIEHHAELQGIMNESGFGLSVDEHKKLKNIPDEADLRDNMTRLELLFSAIGDEAAMIISEREQPSGIDENKMIAKAAGDIVGRQIEGFEQETGGTVLSDSNNLDKKRPLFGGAE